MGYCQFKRVFEMDASSTIREMCDDIHFSTATQVRETLTKHFSSHDKLVVAAFKTDTFSTDLKWEPSRGGQDFPHLYRGLLMTEVEWHSAIKKENGCHSLPEAINELI